jgi:non-ribosomal peptide synthetase component F
MLTLRNFPTPGKTFNVFLQEVKEKALKAFENQDYQYEDLVEQVSVNRDPSRNPIFDVVFSYTDQDQIGVEKPKQEKSGLQNESYRYENNTAKFDLILNGAKTDELLFFNFEYSTKLFKKNTIERFISHFKETMYSVIKNPHARIWEIEIVSEEEEKQLLKTFIEDENNECREHLNPGKDLPDMSKAEFDF